MKTVEWVFPVIGLVMAIGLAWGLGRQQGGEAERRSQTPAAYQASAKREAEHVCGAGPGAFECIYEKVEAGREQASTEQDLSAQQRAANAAVAAAVISFVTLLATVMGVIFVKSTLNATWKTVEAAQDQLAMTKRPELFLQQVELVVSAGFQKGAILLVNAGGSDALITRSEILVLHYDLLPPRHPTREIRPSPWKGTMLAKGGHILWEFDETNAVQGAKLSHLDVKGIKAGSKKLAVIGIVEYAAIEGGRTHQTLFCRVYNSKSGRFLATEDDPDYEARR